MKKFYKIATRNESWCVCIDWLRSGYVSAEAALEQQPLAQLRHTLFDIFV